MPPKPKKKGQTFSLGDFQNDPTFGKAPEPLVTQQQQGQSLWSGTNSQPLDSDNGLWRQNKEAFKQMETQHATARGANPNTPTLPSSMATLNTPAGKNYQSSSGPMTNLHPDMASCPGGHGKGFGCADTHVLNNALHDNGNIPAGSQLKVIGTPDRANRGEGEPETMNPCQNCQRVISHLEGQGHGPIQYDGRPPAPTPGQAPAPGQGAAVPAPGQVPGQASAYAPAPVPAPPAQAPARAPTSAPESAPAHASTSAEPRRLRRSLLADRSAREFVQRVEMKDLLRRMAVEGW
ncbi:hypothetical protein MMC10_008909 [Thelotrema lepadinum]|nr:hypothetical protein [Thelotrema lepadinum]